MRASIRKARARRRAIMAQWLRMRSRVMRYIFTPDGRKHGHGHGRCSVCALDRRSDKRLLCVERAEDAYAGPLELDP